MEGANTYTRTTTVNAEALIVKWLAGKRFYCARAEVRLGVGSCVITSVAGPHGAAQLYEGASAPSFVNRYSRSNQRPGGLAPPAPGPDGAVGLPDWALAIVTPPTSAAVANRVLASVLIEAPPFSLTVVSLPTFQVGKLP